MGEKNIRKTVRFDQSDFDWLADYAKTLPDRETRGGGEGFSDAIRVAVTSLRQAVGRRSDEDARVLAAYYQVKNAVDPPTLLDWFALGAGLIRNPESAALLRAALEMQKTAGSGSGSIRRKRSVRRKGRRSSGGKG